MSSDRRTYGQTESDTYEPTVQYAQVGSKMGSYRLHEKQLKQNIPQEENRNERLAEKKMDPAKIFTSSLPDD